MYERGNPVIEFLQVASIFILALIGVAAVVIIAMGLWLAYSYDITFTVKTAKDKKKPDQNKVQ